MRKIYGLAAIDLIASLPLFAQKRISAEQAKKYIGEKVIVTGKVVRTSLFNKSKERAIMLQLGNNNATSVNIIISNEERKNFSGKPEEYYNQKRVAITGTITENNGKPQILLSCPDNIKLLEQGGGMEIKPLDIEGISRFFE